MDVLFLTPLRLEKQDGDQWKVLEQFVAQVDAAQIAVPAGYVTDLASVPRLPLAYLLAGNRAPKAAVIHDWLYETKAGKDYADNVFLAAMKAEGINRFVARAMYFAVRVFGEGPYERKTA
jgi:hypothetical protein